MASIRCTCARCTLRGLMVPAVVITIGVLILLHQLRGGIFDFGDTWPFILIVAGAVLLASSLAPTTGHIEPVAPPPIRPGRPAGPGPTQSPLGGPGH